MSDIEDQEPEFIIYSFSASELFLEPVEFDFGPKISNSTVVTKPKEKRQNVGFQFDFSNFIIKLAGKSSML